jgi:cell division protein FtsB
MTIASKSRQKRDKNIYFFKQLPFSILIKIHVCFISLNLFIIFAQILKTNNSMNHKLLLIISIVTVVIFFVYVLFFSENNIYKHIELNVKIKQLDENIAKTKNQINNTYTFEQLENDTAGKLEKYAREQLNLQRADEDVFVVVYE